MALRDAQVVLLCEDEQQKNFAYWWLRERGVRREKITPRPRPAGAQAGEQYVRQNYAAEVQAFRSRAARMALALIVVIDADMGEVEQRFRQLDDALRELGQPPRADGEAICVLVPKRNIETWIHYLGPPRSTADEVTDYKPKDPEVCKEAARHLARWTQPEPEAPESLRRALSELDRLRLV